MNLEINKNYHNRLHKLDKKNKIIQQRFNNLILILSNFNNHHIYNIHKLKILTSKLIYKLSFNFDEIGFNQVIVRNEEIL